MTFEVFKWVLTVELGVTALCQLLTLIRGR